MLSFFSKFKLVGIQRSNPFAKRAAQVYHSVSVRLIALVIIFFISVSYLYDKYQNTSLNASASTIASYITEIFYQPIYWVEKQISRYSLYTNLVRENDTLKEKLNSLKADNILLHLKISDLVALKTLLENIDTPMETKYPARVLGSILNFPQATLFAVTENNLVDPMNRIARHPDGLVGRVIENLANNRVRILLLTDHRSRIPVRHHNTGKQAILAGQGTDQLKVLYIESLKNESHEDWKSGDLFVTSGIEQACPPNIPVAELVITQDGELMAKPLVDFHQLRFIILQ
jgi:cell shape-determining protein MreC